MSKLGKEGQTSFFEKFKSQKDKKLHSDCLLNSKGKNVKWKTRKDAVRCRTDFWENFFRERETSL